MTPKPPQPCTATESSLAYILYTSGSTGKPKGVCIENRNVCHYVRAFQHEFKIGPQDIMLQYSVCSFDIFTEEVYASLLNGATLALAPEETRSDLPRLIEFIKTHKITIVSGFPYLLADFNKLPSIPPSIRLLISGGDVLRAQYVSNLIQKVPIYNTYGPSETTCCASYFHCIPGSELKDGTFPIGKAILGSRMELLDDSMHQVADGSIGEICIFGGGIGRGYVTEREGDAFVSVERGGKTERVYRSGDLGHVLPDGNFAFLKRKDEQVMILGKRIEVNEVESVLMKYPGIEKGIVKAYLDTHGLHYLVAYIIPSPSIFSLSSLKHHMAQYLASFMVPEFFVSMPSFPLTPTGKIDRNALPVVLKEGTA